MGCNSAASGAVLVQNSHRTIETMDCLDNLTPIYVSGETPQHSIYRGGRNFSELLILRFRVRIAAGAPSSWNEHTAPQNRRIAVCSLRLVPKENHRILESYQDFILSRQAALLSPRTIEFYERTVGEFISFLSERGIDEPEGITSALVRGYFSSVSERGVASVTVHAHARGTRAFLRFLKVPQHLSL